MKTWQTESAAHVAPIATPTRHSAAVTTAHADDVPGRVRIARRVLHTVVREAALGVPGVKHLSHNVSAWPSLLGRPAPRDGVALTVHKGLVGVDVYLVVEHSLNLVTVGEAVQDAVGAAIEHMLGMGVGTINVFIRDVA